MAITQNGNSFTWTGSVTVTNATDLSTGVATLVLTPAGGVGTLPFLAQGLPGQAPLLTMGAVTTLAAGASATATLTQTSPGGAGTSSAYTLALSVPQGIQGPAATLTISGATDLIGTPTDKYGLIYSTSTNKWTVSPQLVGGLYLPTTISSTAGNGNPRTLCSFTIPSQPYDWRPLVRGYCIVTGTANTRIDLICRINDPATGDQVGYCPGIAGVVDRPILTPAFGGAITGSYGKVLAGNAATIYYIAQEQASNTDVWSTNSSTTAFTVEVKPVQP